MLGCFGVLRFTSTQLQAIRVDAAKATCRLSRGQNAATTMMVHTQAAEAKNIDPAFRHHRQVVLAWATGVWEGMPDLDTSRRRSERRWPGSVTSRGRGRWQSGEICQVSSTGAFTLFCHVVHGFTNDLISFFVTFVLLSCSRVCLLDVSRLLGLTLRHFAPVCSCHRDSFVRWRLAIAHEAARVIFFCVFSTRCACAWCFLTAYEEGPYTRC